MSHPLQRHNQGHNVPQELYARTTTFIQKAIDDPTLAARAKQVSAELVGYFVHLMDFDSWCVFRTALGTHGLHDVSNKVRGWRDAAFQEGDEAAWGYEIISINLAATAFAPSHAAASEAACLTDSILRRALEEASPLDHELDMRKGIVCGQESATG